MHKVAGYEKPKAPETLLEALKLATQLEEEKQKLRIEKETLKQVNGTLNKENNELNGKMNVIKELPNFNYFFELITKTLKDTDYPLGISAREFVDEWNADPIHFEEQIKDELVPTISRRAAGFYRATRGDDPAKSTKTNLTFYSGKDVAYIIATIKLVLRGI